MQTNNLWGMLPRVTEPQRTPLTILREQADVLTSSTKGLLEGELTMLNGTGQLSGQLNIVAPALGRYSMPAIKITYSIFGYPVQVEDFIGGSSFAAPDEPQYIALLHRILSSGPVHGSIKALLAQSMA